MKHRETSLKVAQSLRTLILRCHSSYSNFKHTYNVQDQCMGCASNVVEELRRYCETASAEWTQISGV
jgi:hypothetical protein